MLLNRLPVDAECVDEYLSRLRDDGVGMDVAGRSLLSVGAYEKDFDSVVLRVERELRTTFPAFISGHAEILTGPVVSPRQSKLTESKANAGSLEETSRWEA